MSIDRRKALRIISQGVTGLALPSLAGWPGDARSADDKKPAAKPAPRQTPARNKSPVPADAPAEDTEEEDKKKSTLVDDTEQFGRGRTQMALLLPDIEGPYRFAADAVLRGVMAAHAVDGKGITVKVVRLLDENFADVAQVYRQLKRDRIQQVIGPLIRAEVNGLSRLTELPIPTLGLNLPDREHAIPGNCMLFSLAVEYDGRSAAQFAFADLYQRIGDLRPIRALAISDNSELARRSSDAFLDSWQALGGEVEKPITRDIQTEEQMRRLLSGVRADMVFIAVEPDVLKIIRPAFSAQLPLYGTSQLNLGATPAVSNAQLLATPELDGVRVVEMPWQLEPENPIVALYPRSRRLPHLEMQRLYAFGIDAWRLARDMHAGKQQITLDGVTGSLYVDLSVDPRVSREPLLGEYRQGILMPAYASSFTQPATTTPPGRNPTRPNR